MPKTKVKKNIPNKLFYKIGEVAQFIELEPYVLRYWEGEFNLKLAKSKNNQRLYQKKDIDQIFRIKKLLYDEKFTIAGAKKRLRELKRIKNDSQLSLKYFEEEAPVPTDIKELLMKLRNEIRGISSILK